ncbi:F-box/LRR-repeat protein 2-like isoform X2 [Pollicipes pollicipes]|uniref:F-box/LRR-repeat protein 2-like isoform X2 n=1 Tax=Pollicipes pollicipes TaxID=41117 RepID=UPI001884B83D|nr:F-box/LRR-repeat protein 2-like isoform X2 [Pollicipes pollicipes]
MEGQKLEAGERSLRAELDETRRQAGDTGRMIRSATDNAARLADEREPPASPEKRLARPRILEVKHGRSRDPFERVPAEVLHYILCYLTPIEVLEVRRVSRRWRAAADANLTRCRHLDLTWDDVRDVSEERLEWLLRRLPSLRRLTSGRPVWADSIKQTLSVDMISRLLGHLQEVDLWYFSVDPQSLERLCASCPQLEHVHLPEACTEPCLAALLRHLRTLRRLDMTRADVRGACLSLLPESLEALSVSRCDNLPSACMRQLTRCPRLRELSVTRMETLQSADLAAGLAGCPRLESFTVAGCWGTQSTFLRQLSHCPRLRELDLSYMPDVQAADLAACLAACPDLEKLTVTDCMSIQSACLRQLNRCPRLRELDVSRVRGLQGADLAAGLAGCPQLERLTVTGFKDLQSVCLRQLGCCSLLRELDLSNVLGLRTEDLAAGLAGCPRLERLSVSGCDDLKSTFLRQLTRCRRLRELDVSWVKTLRASDLAAVLAGCPRLERLTAEGLKPALALCLPPAILPSLRCLNVCWSSAVSGTSLELLSVLLPGLHTLKLRGFAVQRADLSGCLLGVFARIRALSLTSPGSATDAALRRLQGFRLKRVDLSWCYNCSEETVTQLVLACPSLTVLGWCCDQSRTEAMLDSLSRHLPPDRDVTLEVDGGLLPVLPRLPPGPLRVREMSEFP